MFEIKAGIRIWYVSFAGLAMDYTATGTVTDIHKMDTNLLYLYESETRVPVESTEMDCLFGY